MATSQKPHRRRWRMIALAAGFVVFIYAAWPGRATFTVGPDTTRVTEPRGADGGVDFVAAADTRLRGGIPPEQNANVLLWQAIGPLSDNGGLPAEYFQRLGVPAPPAAGDYLRSWDAYYAGVLLAAEQAGEEPDFPTAVITRRDQAQVWPWAEAADPVLSGWIAANASPLAVVERAVARPAFYNPLVPDRSPGGDGRLAAALTPAGPLHREAGRLLVCRAMMHLGAGRAAAAWRDLMTCHRLARVIGAGGTLGEWVDGMAVERLALRGEATFISEAKLPADQLAICRDDLARLPPLSRVADKVDGAERLIMLDLIQQFARAGVTMFRDSDDFKKPKLRPPFQERLFRRGVNWDPAQRLANEWLDRYAAALRLTEHPARREALATAKADLLARRVAFRPEWAAPLDGPTGRGTLLGVILVMEASHGFHATAGAEDRLIQQNRNLAAAFALAAYRADHGQYPAALADLTPKYLPRPPKDIDTNADPIYRRTPAGYRLYSVGPNLTDDDGRGPDGDPKGDDLLIEMPGKEPESGLE